MSDTPLGIYIHIPFCASKCIYCDFYSLPDSSALMPDYLNALTTHISESAPRLSGYAVDTVYFGGGTPSLFGAANLIKVLQCIKKNYNLRLDSEITLEANPDSMEFSELKKLRRAGFNRISIGVQSANDEILKALKRRHTFAQAEKAVDAAKRVGFDNISIDLIYGLPGQTRGDWANTLARAASLKVQHISCYGLKIEPNTPLFNMQSSLDIPDDDAQADMYLYAVDALNRYGFKQYEISNFAQRGRESQHNLKYWQLGDYAGFGPAAHSFIGGARFSYISDVSAYIKGIAERGSMVDSMEDIGRFESLVEYIMLNLRTTRGICESEYYNIYHLTFTPLARQLEEYEKHGLARLYDGRWSFTPRGFLISNRLIGQLLDILSDLKVAPSALLKSHSVQNRFDDEDIQLHL